MKPVRLGMLAAFLVLLAAPPGARGHIVHQRDTLSDFVASADLIVIGVIEDAARIVKSPTSGFSTHSLTVRVERVLKGQTDQRRIPFVNLRRGVPHYATGARALLFLTRIEKERELVGRELGDRFRWFTYQEPEQAYGAEGEGGEALVAGVTRLIAIEKLPEGRRFGALREALLAFAESDVSTLRVDALHELHEIGNLKETLRKGDVKRLGRVLGRREVPVPDRVALIAILAEMPGFDAAGSLIEMLGEADTGEERLEVLTALVPYADPRADAQLRKLLQDRDPGVRARAVAGLGRPGQEEDVPRLLRCTRDPEPYVQRTAVNALGGVGGGRALKALREVAKTHPDPVIRRWAEVHIRRLD